MYDHDWMVVLALSQKHDMHETTVDINNNKGTKKYKKKKKKKKKIHQNVFPELADHYS